jgi:hypothetical protein
MPKNIHHTTPKMAQHIPYQRKLVRILSFIFTRAYVCVCVCVCVFIETLMERDRSEDLRIDGKIILKWTMGKYGRKVWTGCIDAGQEPVAGCCEHGNEP